MDIPLNTVSIGTRDGTLTKDPKCVNFLNGRMRPGLVLYMQLPAGAGQGMFIHPTLGPAAIVANNIYSLTTGLLISAIPLGIGPYEVIPTTTAATVVLKDLQGIWVMTGAAVVKVVTAPTPTLSGFVYLDGTYYCLTVAGVLMGSALNAPTVWDPLNSLPLQADFGTPVCIARQLNYLLAMTDKYIMPYYDAGAPPPGSPLLPTQSAYMDIGCASAGSVTEHGNMLFFVGKTTQRGRSVYLMQGLQSQIISTTGVDAILDKSTLVGATSWALKLRGESLYVLQLPDVGLTLVYSLTGQTWGLWSSSLISAPDPIIPNNYTQGAFLYSSYMEATGFDLVQHPTSGAVVALQPTAYMDLGLPIDVTIVTPVIEAESSDWIRIAAIELVGDKVPATAYASFTEDDYATWTAFRPVNLLTTRSRLNRQGSTRGRAYTLRYTAPFPLRLKALQLVVET